jgi:hypothetical protein
MKKIPQKLPVVAILLMFVLACAASIKIQNYAIQNIDTYKLKIQKDGLKIAVDPIQEDKRLEDYFGCDLLSRGILPVFLMIENQNSKDGYVVVAERISLMRKIQGAKSDKYEGRATGIKLQEEQISKEMAVSSALLTASPMAIPLLPVATIFALSAQGRMKDDSEIRRNLEDKKLEPKTLFQGGAQNGFIYFKINEKKDIENVQGINLGVRNLRTGELSIFTITFN